jgi:hypothetical protein
MKYVFCLCIPDEDNLPDVLDMVVINAKPLTVLALWTNGKARLLT